MKKLINLVFKWEYRRQLKMSILFLKFIDSEFSKKVPHWLYQLIYFVLSVELFGVAIYADVDKAWMLRTKEVFQKYYKKKLSKEDVYEIRMRLKDFGFKLLEIDNED